MEIKIPYKTEKSQLLVRGKVPVSKSLEKWYNSVWNWNSSSVILVFNMGKME